MARFLGTFEHTLDPKGRLILPAAFRAKLADGAVITPLDHCLAILPTDEFDAMADRLELQVSEGIVDVNALRHFAGKADEVVPDSQGRVRILAHLRELAGLDRSVIVNGALRRVEVWNPERWNGIAPVGAERLTAAIEKGHGFGGR